MSTRQNYFPQSAINATGVVLHTGLGRAPWSVSAMLSEKDACGYCVLELDSTTGERGERTAKLEELLALVTGAEAGLAVNNNAAAVLLTLAALARNLAVAVAHADLVEIGGSFRLPEVFAQSGCQLMAVGAANCATVADYEKAIKLGARVIVVAHQSNFWFEGEFHAPALSELAALAKYHQIPLLYDLGSGAMINLAAYGILDESTVGECLQAGADIVCFSGDKLFGGPQAGLIVGGKELIERIHRHPLYRALRLDKTILAGIYATLQLYAFGQEVALREIPTLRMLTESAESSQKRALKVWEALGEQLQSQCEIVQSTTKPGGGTLPRLTLPSYALALHPIKCTPRELAQKLRLRHPSIWGHLSGHDLLLELRTVNDGQIAELTMAVREEMSG